MHRGENNPEKLDLRYQAVPVGEPWSVLVTELLTPSGKFFPDHRLQRLPVLQAGQYLVSVHEHRDASDACLLVGVTQSLLMNLLIFPAPQRLLELPFIQSAPDATTKRGESAAGCSPRRRCSARHGAVLPLSTTA